MDTQERLTVEGVAVAADVGEAVILNYMRSTDPDW
jgi:hypothetical protein